MLGPSLRDPSADQRELLLLSLDGLSLLKMPMLRLFVGVVEARGLKNRDVYPGALPAV